MVALDCEPTFDSRASPINNAINLLIGRRVQPLAKSAEAGQDIPAEAYCVSPPRKRITAAKALAPTAGGLTT